MCISFAALKFRGTICPDMDDDRLTITERARAIHQLYEEFVVRLEALRQKHNDEISTLIHAFEQRKIAEIRKAIGGVRSV